jgi:hypothetical protein
MFGDKYTLGSGAAASFAAARPRAPFERQQLVLERAGRRTVGDCFHDPADAPPHARKFAFVGGAAARLLLPEPVHLANELVARLLE